MRNLQKRKQEGFTLVELLIVIIIIGILAGAMMMLMGSSSDKAEATKVVSDLRTLKGAALQYYADNNNVPGSAENAEAFESYVDKDLTDGYALVNVGGAGNVFYVGVSVPNQGALDKLEQYAQAESADIFYSTYAADTAPASNDNLGGNPAPGAGWAATDYAFMQAK